MKLWLILLLTLLSPMLCEGSWKIFGCGLINQPDTASSTQCVKKFDDGHFNVEICTDTDYHCQSLDWTRVEQTSTAICRPTIAKVMVGLPGDTWVQDSDCFGDTQDLSWDGGVCVTTKTIDSTCPDSPGTDVHKYCPPGSYCFEGKCTAQVGKDTNCQKGSCKFGYQCVAKDANLDDYRCTSMNSIGDQTTFKIDRVTNGDNIWTGINSLCSSYNSESTDDADIRICRKADISEGQKIEKYRRDNPGEKWSYTTFNDDYPIEGEPTSDVSHCGFNIDSFAYCPMRKGDTWFKDRLKDLRTNDFTTLNCHSLSLVENCQDFIDNIDKGTIHRFNQSILAVDPDFGYHLIANNDNWVARSITEKFWNGHAPGLAYPTFGLTLALISNLFYVTLY